MLLTAGARVTNSGKGRPPTLIEPVTGEIVLRGLDGAVSVSLSPLDGAGRPMGQALRAEKHGGGWEMKLGESVTTWYEITVER